MMTIAAAFAFDSRDTYAKPMISSTSVQIVKMSSDESSAKTHRVRLHVDEERRIRRDQRRQRLRGSIVRPSTATTITLTMPLDESRNPRVAA